MAAPAITLYGLRKLGPCNIPDGLPERGKITAAEARKCGVSFNGVVWVASRMALNDPDIERRLRLWIADCSAHVLHIYEQDEASDVPRNAIVASRKFARGETDTAARIAASASAMAAANAEMVARAAAARLSPSSATRASAWSSAWNAAWSAEVEWQFDRLIAWLGDAEPDDWPLP